MVAPLLAAGARAGIQSARVIKGTQTKKSRRGRSIARKSQPTTDEIARRVPQNSIEKTQEIRANKKKKENEQKIFEPRLDKSNFMRGINKKIAKRSRKTLPQLTVKKRKAIRITRRIWSRGFIWMYFLIQVPTAVFALAGLGAESFSSAIPIAGKVIERIIPGETAFFAGSSIAFITGWITMIGGLVYYYVNNIKSFSTIPQIFVFCFSVGAYVAPGLNLLPCAMFWMLVVIWQADD